MFSVVVLTFDKRSAVSHGECRRNEAIDIQSDIGEQFVTFAVFDESIGNSKALEV